MPHIANNGTTFEIHGNNENPCIILIHGLGLNKEIWQWLVPTLKKTYQIITFDLYGHGDSANPPETPSLSLFSKQINELLKRVNKTKASLIGFSLGCMICRRFAQDYPEKTEALIILNSPYKRSQKAQNAILNRLTQLKSDGPESTIEDALVRWFSDKYRSENPKLLNVVRNWVMKNDPKIYPKIYEVLATGILEITSPIPKISCPTLVITGDEDFGNGPEMAYAIAAEIPKSKVLILKGLRHMALAEAPDTVNKPIKEFLNEVARVVKS